jgi:hypothetical protein
MYVIQHFFIPRPSDSTVSEDAGIEPSTVETFIVSETFFFLRFWHRQPDALTTRLDLIGYISSTTQLYLF